jgi:RHS repeat-associated protein
VYDNSNNAVPGMSYPVGQLTTETAYSGGAAYTTQQTGFNVFGESLGQTVTIPSSEGALGGSYTFGHVYSGTTGLLLKDIYPSAGGLPSETVLHAYATPLDLPTTVNGLSGYAQGVTYDAFSRVNQETIGSSPDLAYLTDTYDLHTGNLTDQLVTRAVTTPADVDEESYSYDPAGNITSQTSTRLGSAATSETQCFVYDQLDRLTAAWTATDNCATQPSSSNSSMVGDSLGASSAYWTTWSYDAVGNRTGQVQHSTTGGTDTSTSYTYSGNGTGQPGTLTGTNTTGAATGSTSYAYDAAGNMTSRDAGQGNQTLNWNDAGLLTSITGGTAGDSSFVYDADGNLLLEKDPGATTLYLPDEQITLSGSTTSGVRYYALPGGGLAYRTGNGNSYGFEMTDQHGTAFLTLDDTAQNPTWRQFTPYGAPRGPAATWIDNRGFLGKPADASTGLTIIGAREYDTATGRFISLDPILESSSPLQLNGYTYAADNPVSQSDPSGQMPCADGVCGSFQYLEHHFSSSSGGGGGSSSGICYYCHYAPPQYYATRTYYTYNAGNTFIAAPSQSALHAAILAAQNKIGAFYMEGEVGYPVTSNRPEVRLAVAQTMCTAHPSWCVQFGTGPPSFWSQMSNVFGAIVMAGIGGEGGDVEEPVPSDPVEGGEETPAAGSEIYADRHGNTTNGVYTINSVRQELHMPGTAPAGNSVFSADVNADQLTLDAAVYADENNLWVDNRAKVQVTNYSEIGTTGRGGGPTNWINLYRRNSGTIHGCPGNAPC